ncbi:MAG TPA: ATP-binding protein [Puia sp.]|nr:ATP-binding protein [Puia sp.]
MSDFKVSLSNCDREPIHIPGKIQSHGFMLALDQNGIIRFFSDNITSFIPDLEGTLLGKTIEGVERFFENAPHLNMLEHLLYLGRLNGYEQINPYPVNISGKKYYLIISRTAGFELLEFELDTSAGEKDIQKMIGKSVSQMLADKSLQNLLNNTVVQVKHIIDYDRVMIYRFAEDGHGEVVAEAKNDGLESWMFLHYPASDIPKQARELYKLNLTRLIADVNATSSNISAEASQTEPLDLTWSQLRAVSPIHIQYLINMGVASSFSISLIYKNQLWGLVACHNYTPKFINYKSRESAKLIGQVLSSALEFRQEEEIQLLNDRFKDHLDLLGKYLQTNDNLSEALMGEAVNILTLTHATGAALVYERQVFRIGITPEEVEIRRLVEWTSENINDPLYSSTNISAVYPDACTYQKMATGVLILELTKELKEYIFWFKPEQVQTVKWAGNPNKPVELNDHGLLQISPRHSFQVWSEQVKGLSEQWGSEELQSARRLKEEINDAINLKARTLRQLNDRLREAYEELDSFSYTISHDLKNPIAKIKGYAQLLRGTDAFGELESTMVEKVIEGADKMNVMIGDVLNYSKVGRQEMIFQKVDMDILVNDIVKDLNFIYAAGKVKITVGNTPFLMGDPLMLMQVFSNLIGNAVKYSQEVDLALVHIEGVINKQECVYSVRDNGHGIAECDLPKIFDLFSRMSNVSHIEGSGVGLAIVKRIVERHGARIRVESQPGKGSVFYVAFKN